MNKVSSFGLVFAIAILLHSIAHASIIADNVLVSDPFTVFNTQTFNEIDIDQSSTLNVFGGDVFFVNTFHTSLTNLSSGSIFELSVNHQSTFNMAGGLVDSLSAFGVSQIEISDGIIQSELFARGTSQVSILGGTLSDILFKDNAVLDFKGGSASSIDLQHNNKATVMNASLSNLIARGTSSVEIFSATFLSSSSDEAKLRSTDNASMTLHSSQSPNGLNITVDGQSQFDVLGGENLTVNVASSGIINIKGGEIIELDANGNGQTNVFGSDLKIFLDPIDQNTYLTGKLMDGTTIRAQVIDGRSIGIHLIEVPTPHSAVILVLGAVGCGLYPMRRHRA